MAPGVKRRLLSRVLAAIGGGYALASAWTVFLGAVLPGPRAESVLLGVQCSFAIYTAAIIWAFAVSGLRRVWLGLLLPAAALAGLGVWWP